MTRAQDGERLIRYLLGELPPGEQDALETEYFSDDEVFAAVQAAEDGLVDAFVRGELGEARRQAFEARYAGSGDGRRKIAFARALLGIADQRAPALPRRRPFSAVVAAGLAAAVVGGALSWPLRDARQELARARALQDDRAREAREQEARARVLAEELGRARARQEQLQDLLAEARRPLRVASFALAAGISRDEGARTLRVPAGVGLVQLHLLPEGEPYPSYAVKLQTAEGRDVWQARGLRLRPAGRGTAVTITLGAETLPAGDYVAGLTGIDRDGRPHDLAGYVFRVTPPGC